MGCSFAFLVGLDELFTSSSYFFKYYWREGVPAIGRASCSAVRINSSSSESVREATFLSAFLEEAHTTLQEDALALTLDYILVTVVHYWLWIMSG